MRASWIRHRDTLVASALAGITLLSFMPCCWNGFVNFDDPDYVTRNAQVRAGLTVEGIGWAFTTTHAANWHPLTWLSLQLDMTLFGERPFGFHLTNLLLHTVSTVLLFFFLRWTTGALWRSAVVATLFGIHPLHVESVAWVAERKDVLSGLFWMLTMLAYVRFVRKRTWRRYLAVLAALAAGLIAKPMLVTLPCVLLLLDYWPLARPESWRRLALEKWPLFVLVAVSCGITWYAQSHGGALRTMEHFGLGERAGNAVIAYMIYLSMMLWPFHSAVFYSHPGPSLVLPQAVLAALSLAGISWFCLKWGKNHPYLRVGWLWYLGTLVPVIGLIQVGNQAMADRYTYIPLIGIFLIVVWGSAELAYRQQVSRRALAGGTIILLALCFAGAWRQITFWHDSLTLWQHAHDVGGPSPTVYVNLVETLVDKGKLAEAVVCGRRALHLFPDDAKIYLNLGAALDKAGNPQDALPLFQEAVRLDPADPLAHLRLGIALGKLKRTADAARHLREAIRLDPADPLAHVRLAAALENLGKTAEAGFYYDKGLGLPPRSARDHYNLGTILAQQEKLDLAVEQLLQAVRLEPESGQVNFNLGLALKKLGRTGEALDFFRRAVFLQPQLPNFRLTLAVSLSENGQVAEAFQLDPHWPWKLGKTAWVLATHPRAAVRQEKQAVAYAELVCKVTKGQEPIMIDTLAAAYAAVGQFDRAVASAEKALKLAQKKNYPGLAAAIRDHLALYRQGKVFRDAGLP